MRMVVLVLVLMLLPAFLLLRADHSQGSTCRVRLTSSDGELMFAMFGTIPAAGRSRGPRDDGRTLFESLQALPRRRNGFQEDRGCRNEV